MLETPLSCLRTRNTASATVLLQEVPNPKDYGLVEGSNLEEGVLRLTGAEEKPDVPKTNQAIMPVYIFNEEIFEALSVIQPGKGGELQPKDAIQQLITSGSRVIGVKLKPRRTQA